MKFTILGIVLMMVAVGLAGNWLYNPVATQDIEKRYEPIAHYPEGDEADNIFSSNLTYIPSKDMYCVEYNYVWVNASGHTPDTEEVRIYIRDGEVHHVELRIHYEWIEINDFAVEGDRVHIYFTSIYHTPYTSESSLTSSTIERALPIALTMLAGIGCIVYDTRKKNIKDFFKKHFKYR